VTTTSTTFDGIEIDMLSLGDADCIIVTSWYDSWPYRVLIDGGTGGSYDEVMDFLNIRGFKNFWAVVCSHCHDDHASGLIKLVKNSTLSFQGAWMHDIRNHVAPDALRRASAADDGVKQVVETTRELASAFKSRSITPKEPFAGERIAWLPNMQVLGPTLAFYRRAISEFTDEPTRSSLAWALAGLRASSSLGSSSAAWPSPETYLVSPPAPRSLANLFYGSLAGSSVQEEPETQPYNNTSTILGTTFNGLKYLFTGDAGSEALDQVPADWHSLEWMQIPHHGSDGNLSQKNIESYRPRLAYVSATGDTSHPSRAIVNGLIKVGSTVYSTHENGHLRSSCCNVPFRYGYYPATPMKATGGMKISDLALSLR